MLKYATQLRQYNKQYNTYTQQPEMLKHATQISQYTFYVSITMFCAMSCF
jgi:hypothetical protein